MAAMGLEGRAIARHPREPWEAPRRGRGRSAGRDDRRLLRRVAAGLCLLLALLIAAAATLSAQTVPGEPDAKKLPGLPRHRLPLLIPVIFLVFLVVVGAVVRRPQRRTTPATPALPAFRHSRLR